MSFISQTATGLGGNGNKFGKKGNPYSITERRVSELIPVLSSQPARDVSYKPGVRLHYFLPGLQLTLATIKRAANNFAAW